MQIGSPIIHLEKQSSGTYHIHVITWFDQTTFVADGHDTISTTAVSGVFPITLFVREDTGVPNMNLLTPVVHTITLTGVALTSSNPFIEVEVVNTTDSSSVDKKKIHRDGAGSTAMPDPGTGNRN